MTSDKRVEEMSHKFRQLCAGDVCAGGLPDFDKAFRTVVTQDRAALHTSLVAAVEGKKRCEHKWEQTSYKCTKCGIDEGFANGDIDYNNAIKDTLTIINSIFNE